MSTGRSRVPAGVRDWAIAVCVAATLLVAGVSEHPAAGGDPLGYALLVAGGLALAARRRAPVAVLAVTGLCAVGYFLAHASNGFFPILNKGELIARYCFVFLYIAAAGPWSLDALRKR